MAMTQEFFILVLMLAFPQHTDCLKSFDNAVQNPAKALMRKELNLHVSALSKEQVVAHSNSGAKSFANTTGNGDHSEEDGAPCTGSVSANVSFQRILRSVCTACTKYSEDFYEIGVIGGFSEKSSGICEDIYGEDPDSGKTKMCLTEGRRRSSTQCLHPSLKAGDDRRRKPRVRVNMKRYAYADENVDGALGPPKICACLDKELQRLNALTEGDCHAGAEPQQRANCVIKSMCGCDGVCEDFKDASGLCGQAEMTETSAMEKRGSASLLEKGTAESLDETLTDKCA